MIRGGIYDEIYPEPEGNPEGEAQENFRGLWLYYIAPNLSHNTDILNYNSRIDLSEDQYLKC